jgi:hypothetical protein
MRSILSTVAILFAITIGYVGFAEDAHAFGRGRHAGCGAAAAASCAGAYESAGCSESYSFHPFRRAGFKRRHALRASYGCGGALAASCSAPATSCSDGYGEAPPAPVSEVAPEPATLGGHYEMRRVLPERHLSQRARLDSRNVIQRSHVSITTP